MDVIDLKVTLHRVKPDITRQLVVPVALRLDRLHLTLQTVMGWSNSHLYQFEAKGITWSEPYDDEVPDYSDDLPANKSRIIDVLQETGVKTINYIYDFGDHWEHKLKFGRIQQGFFDTYYPKLLFAQNRCPPEDCGGASGYAEFLNTLADPGHEDHEGILEWVSDPNFDPHDCDSLELGFALDRQVKRWGHRSKDKTVFLD